MAYPRSCPEDFLAIVEGIEQTVVSLRITELRRSMSYRDIVSSEAKGSLVPSGPIPKSLDGWTFAVVEALCAVGYSESDRHDFKFDLPEPKGLTRIACAFANTFGGFVVLGVSDRSGGFEPVGIDPDSEIYGRFHSKVRAEPEIGISYPRLIEVPGTRKGIYVFEVLQSTRRPHLPSPADERTFWKRVGSSCQQMTLEEIRQQMLSLEEKREKLALLLMDLYHKERAVIEDSQWTNAAHSGVFHSFEIIDRVVAESYSILRDDPNTIGVLDTLRKHLQRLNARKQQLMQVMALTHDESTRAAEAAGFRALAQQQASAVATIAQQVERSFAEKFGIQNPHRPWPR